MLKNRLHSTIFPLIALKNGFYVQTCSPVTNSLNWSNSSKHLWAHARDQSTVAYSTKYMTLKAIVTDNEKSRCTECKRVFTENPLSKRSKQSCICVGCKRLYAQCRNDLDMKLMKSAQTFKFGHGTYNHNMMYQHINVQDHKYFTANKSKLNVQADFTSLTWMAERWGEGMTADYDGCNSDIWNEQHLNLSTLLDVRASNFLQDSKKRYRKLLPDANLANEKFVFPSKSQVRGLMEASNGICRWSGLRGLWKTDRSSFSTPLFLLTIDHIVPISKNGSPNLDNLQVVLLVYNSVKSNESEDEFQRWLFYS